MNPIEKLREFVEANFSKARLTLEMPESEDGTWFLEVTLNGRITVVEWNDRIGFGISSVGNEGYGERPDENYKSLPQAQRRVEELLTTGEETTAPWGNLISRLREIRRCTQQELADRLLVKQATISGIERRGDIQFSTLKRVAVALGGTLEIYVSFSEARYRLDEGRSFEIDPAATPISAPSIQYEQTFEALRDSGELALATKRAQSICDQHTVLDIP